MSPDPIVIEATRKTSERPSGAQGTANAEAAQQIEGREGGEHEERRHVGRNHARPAPRALSPMKPPWS